MIIYLHPASHITINDYFSLYDRFLNLINFVAVACCQIISPLTSFYFYTSNNVHLIFVSSQSKIRNEITMRKIKLSLNYYYYTDEILAKCVGFIIFFLFIMDNHQIMHINIILLMSNKSETILFLFLNFFDVKF